MICIDIRCLHFFFFQAEDGIRDWSVTGVQTCALPISDLKPDSNSEQSSLATPEPDPSRLYSSSCRSGSISKGWAETELTSAAKCAWRLPARGELSGPTRRRSDAATSKAPCSRA